MDYAQIIGRLQADPVMLQLVLGGAALALLVLGLMLWRGRRRSGPEGVCLEWPFRL